MDKDKLAAVQLLRNGAIRTITYKDAADCDRAVSNGIVCGDVALRVVSVEAKSRLVYLRDCPVEVPDSTVQSFFSSYGEVHSVTRCQYDGFPGLFDGNWVAKVSLTKDIPASVRVAGFDCRVWYRRQPAFCAICKKSGHRSRSCPLDGLCRRCRQPGHVAKECKNAWGSRRSARDAPSGASVPSTSTASAARRLAPAASPAADAAPDDSEPVIKDVEMCSGDEEVVTGAAQAAAAAASSSRPAPRRRHQHRNRGSIPFLPPGTVGIHRPADLSSLKMELSVDDESKVSFLYTFDEVWRDQLT